MTSKLGEQGSLHARSLAVSQRAAPVGQGTARLTSARSPRPIAG